MPEWLYGFFVVGGAGLVIAAIILVVYLVILGKGMGR